MKLKLFYKIQLEPLVFDVYQRPHNIVMYKRQTHVVAFETCITSRTRYTPNEKLCALDLTDPEYNS